MKISKLIVLPKSALSRYPLPSPKPQTTASANRCSSLCRLSVTSPLNWLRLNSSATSESKSPSKIFLLVMIIQWGLPVKRTVINSRFLMPICLMLTDQSLSTVKTRYHLIGRTSQSILGSFWRWNRSTRHSILTNHPHTIVQQLINSLLRALATRISMNLKAINDWATALRARYPASV